MKNLGAVKKCRSSEKALNFPNGLNLNHFYLSWFFIAGAFCDRQSDCKDPDLCCVREAAINPAISICKPALDEHQTCGPYNQYRTLYIGGTVQPACGPCKQGLTCKQVG